MDTEDRTVSKDTTTSIHEETYAENSSTEIVAVADVHVGVVEGTEIYDEPPKEIPKTVKKWAKSSAKELTKKKTPPDESDPNSFDVETEKDLAEWYRENETFYKWWKWEVGLDIIKQSKFIDSCMLFFILSIVLQQS